MDDRERWGQPQPPPEWNGDDRRLSGRRSLDAEHITFRLRLVLTIIGGFLSAFVGIWAVTYGMRSDITIMRQQMTDQIKLDEAKAMLLDERFRVVNEALADAKRRLELQQYETQRINETLAVLKKGRE